MEIKAIYDLSTPLKSGMATWPDNPEIKIVSSPGVEKEGFLVETYSSFTHSGTHVDAPAHFVAKAPTVDTISLKTLVGKGYCIRPEVKGTEINHAALEKKWKPEFEGKILLIHTGWDRKRGFNREFQYEFPGLSYDAIEFFREHRVKMIGLDTLGIEPYDHSDYRVHKELLSLGIPFIEDMAGLDQLEEGKEYLIAALPLKIEKGSGSMARVVAIDFGEE